MYVVGRFVVICRCIASSSLIFISGECRREILCEVECQFVVVVPLERFQRNFRLLPEGETVFINVRLGEAGSFQEPFVTQYLGQYRPVDNFQLPVSVNLPGMIYGLASIESNADRSRQNHVVYKSFHIVGN